MPVNDRVAGPAADAAHPATEETVSEETVPEHSVPNHGAPAHGASEETAPFEEGCLSVPEIYDEVERPARVRIRYLNYQGDEVIEDCEGLYAVCIQHEMDHLNGVLFIDHLSRLKRDRAVQKVKKLKREEAA